MTRTFNPPHAQSPSGDRMLVEERRRRILELLEKQERVTVAELVRRFGVSAVTVRSDLDALGRIGALVRSHGGALRQLEAHEIPITVKRGLHHGEKVRIGQRAAEMIRPDDTVILDSGTTTVEVARQIRMSGIKPLTIITNALNVATELASQPQVRVIMLGGILRPLSLSLVGPHAEHTLRELNADRLFLGVDGLDLEVGLTTPDVLEAQLNAMMIRVSREVVVVADSSKFHQRSLSFIAKTSAAHKVITDARAEAAVVDALRAQDIEVIVV